MDTTVAGFQEAGITSELVFSLTAEIIVSAGEPPHNLRSSEFKSSAPEKKVNFEHYRVLKTSSKEKSLNFGESQQHMR